MDRRRRSCMTPALAAAIIVVAALAAAAQPPRPGPRRLLRAAPLPAVQALQRLEGCDGFRAYLVDAIVEQLVRSWLGRWRFLDGLPVSSGNGESSGPTDYTTTNNQEAGVDELDLVKTDGWHLYVAMDGWLRIVRSWPAAESEELAALKLPGYTHGLFLRHDLVAVLSDASGVRPLTNEWRPATRIDLVDVSNREAPALRRTVEVEGTLVGARLIDGELYAVLTTWLPVPEQAWNLLWQGDLGLPEVPIDASPAEREAAAAKAREILRPHVEVIARDLDLDKVIPALRDRDLAAGTEVEKPMLGCAQIFRPTKVGSFGMLSLIHLDLDAVPGGGGVVSGVGLLADGWTVYATSRTLYVANGQPWWWWGSSEASAAIHKFSLGDPAAPVRYLASGTVPGYLLDQFAMSEHQGCLRVASTELAWWGAGDENRRRGSAVTVLKDDGRGALTQVGQVSDIAPGERIFAARFLGEVGFLVTFEQVDPLFTLDLADPTKPRVVGELVLPGFSSYLHPMSEGYLLAVGRAEDSTGRPNELAVNVFDVRDPARPRLAQQHVIERGDHAWSWSEALSDPHAFTFRRGILSLPVGLVSMNEWLSGLVVLEVDATTGIRELGRVNHADIASPGGWAWMRRSVYVEQYLYSLSSAGLKASLLQRPGNVVAVVPFRRAPPKP
ncbi:MAG: beta-propeller domain-containing protein [Acidobacteriota bacterium]